MILKLYHKYAYNYYNMIHQVHNLSSLMYKLLIVTQKFKDLIQ